jgi:hypothetical protein
MNLTLLKKRFTRSELFNFFLICAFPFHLWAIIMLIRDVGWITQRSGTDSFVSLASLTMVYALVESILFFGLLLILGLLIPWRWQPKRVFAILGFIALWIPIWDMLNQVLRATDMKNPGFMVGWLFSTGHPIRYGYPLLGLIILLVAALTAAGIWLSSFNQKFWQGLGEFLSRVATLSAIYLVLDLAGLIISIIHILG